MHFLNLLFLCLLNGFAKPCCVFILSFTIIQNFKNIVLFVVELPCLLASLITAYSKFGAQNFSWLLQHQQHKVNYEGLTWKMLDIFVALVWPHLHPTMSNNAQQDAQQCWDLLSEMLHWFGHIYIQQCPTMPSKTPNNVGIC